MLNSILSALSNPAVITVITLIVESILHMIPSTKPLGILHGISAVVEQIANASAALASFLDKVIPQNVVSAPAAPNSTQPPTAS